MRYLIAAFLAVVVTCSSEAQARCGRFGGGRLRAVVTAPLRFVGRVLHRERGACGASAMPSAAPAALPGARKMPV